MAQSNNQWIKWVAEIQAIAQSGRAYTQSPFDVERFNHLLNIASNMASALTPIAKKEFHEAFTLQKGYATPKVDIRSFVLKNDQVLLVRERADQLWTIPGGFADVNETPSEAVIRETKEESGFDVKPLRLLTVWDILKHDHPQQWPHLYKMIFHCELLAGHPQQNIEISEIDFFPINHLPPLSTPRITQKQLECLYHLSKQSGPTIFD